MTPDALSLERAPGLLRDAISKVGIRAFVATPVLLPITEDFPERFFTTADGVALVASRLLEGPELDLEVEVADESKGLSGNWNIEARYDGQGSVQLVVFSAGPSDQLPSLLAHLLGPAVCEKVGIQRSGEGYRGARGEIEVASLEAIMAGVACGWGPLLLTGAFRLGLEPDVIAYVIAMQLSIRELNGDSETRPGINEALSGDELALIGSAEELLEGENIRSLLRLEDHRRWPAIVPREREVPLMNAGRPVFRYRETSRIGLLILGTAIGVLAGLITQKPHLTIPLAWLVFYFVSYLRDHDRCSDSECKKTLPIDAKVCPGCGGVIAGRVTKLSDRLEAAEAWEEEHGISYRAPDSGRFRARVRVSNGEENVDEKSDEKNDEPRVENELVGAET